MSIPTPPTSDRAASLATKISVELEHLAVLHRQVDGVEATLTKLGHQMLRDGASQLDVLTALNGGVHPEEDDPHSVWCALEAWNVVEPGDGTRP